MVMEVEFIVLCFFCLEKSENSYALSVGFWVNTASMLRFIWLQMSTISFMWYLFQFLLVFVCWGSYFDGGLVLSFVFVEEFSF